VEGWFAARNEATGCGIGLSLGIDVKTTVYMLLCLLCRFDFLDNYVVKQCHFITHPALRISAVQVDCQLDEEGGRENH
jgi:hypothetical protein